jgi:hypothetical protein
MLSSRCGPENIRLKAEASFQAACHGVHPCLVTRGSTLYSRDVPDRFRIEGSLRRFCGLSYYIAAGLKYQLFLQRSKFGSSQSKFMFPIGERMRLPTRPILFRLMIPKFQHLGKHNILPPITKLSIDLSGIAFDLWNQQGLTYGTCYVIFNELGSQAATGQNSFTKCRRNTMLNWCI